MFSQRKVRGLEILAGIFGCLIGIIGALPYIIMGRLMRKKFVSQGPRVMLTALLIPLISALLVIAAIFVFWLIVPQYLMIFAVVGIVVFLICTVMFTMLRLRRG